MSIKIKRNDLRLLLVCAFRYALGRRTYMPNAVTELMIRYRDLFTKYDFKQFIEDIAFQEDLKNLGDSCDIETWNNFKEFCKNKIDILEN